MDKLAVLAVLYMAVSCLTGVRNSCWKLAIQGYALLCVGYPTSDVEVKTQDEDEYIGFNLDDILHEDQWGDRVKSVKTGKHQV
ncbi:hypothetical protein RIF29_20467 [Crotalaria pallida]|uniref:Uncharacterized protein n=1 Tax=Crotalaria pallida TaxID=3830 RepID=A0AAN9I528_CROPI